MSFFVEVLVSREFAEMSFGVDVVLDQSCKCACVKGVKSGGWRVRGAR